mmetsp:Transcript_44771/g.130370  ORF Transcript_44771/g.130370 Transcript_44771/m.130370 type:complete len:262 (+) Transcript_44771:454-1239(+)
MQQGHQLVVREALVQMARREPFVDLSAGSAHPRIQVAHEEDSVVVLVDPGVSLQPSQRRVRQDPREVFRPLVHLVRVRGQVRVDEEDGGAANVETNLHAAFVADEVADARSHLRGLYVPDEGAQGLLHEHHDVDGAHVVRTDQSKIVAQVVQDLGLETLLVLPDHGLFDGSLALASAYHIDVVRWLGAQPRCEVGRGGLAMQVPHTAEDADDLPGGSLQLRQLGATPEVPLAVRILAPLLDGPLLRDGAARDVRAAPEPSW